MADNSPKLVKTISEAERVGAAVESINRKLTRWADVFEQIDDRLGDGIDTLAKTMRSKPVTG